MIRLLRLFFNFKSANPWLILACLFVASMAEGFSIAGALPLIALATGGSEEDQSELARLMSELFGTLGIDPTLEVLLLIIVGGIVAKALLTLLAMRTVGYAAATVSTELRRDLVDGLLKVRWSYFTGQPVGRIASAMSNEATRAGKAYLSTAMFLANALQTLVYVLIAFLLAWKVALGAVVLCTVIGVALHRFVRQARKQGRRQTLRTSDLVAYLTDGLYNVKPLKAMAKQAAFEGMVEEKIQKLRSTLRRQVDSQELLKCAQQILFILLLGTALLLAFRYADMHLGELLIIAVVLVQTVNKIGRIQRDYQSAVTQEASHLSLSQLIEEVRATEEVWPGRALPSFERGCRFERVSFGYDERPVLRDVSLHIPRGSLTVIMGASGAGKTTITDLLLGLYRPTSGRILVDEVPLEALDVARWRAGVGYVAQELVLFHDSVYANIALGDPAIDESQVIRALEAAGAWEFVSALPEGLQTTVGEKGSQLSGGQRQRIALARALVGDPQLLILDEVTSALDPKTEQEICRTLAGLAGRLTIVTITHRPQLVEIADQVLELVEGRLQAAPGAAPQRSALKA